MTENNEFIPDFSGDDLADNKEIQRTRAERKAYEKLISDSLAVVRQELNAHDSSHLNFKGFHMFKSLTATVKQTIKSVTNEKDIRISLAEYHSAFPIPRYSNAGEDQYLFGHISLNTRYPRTYIHKETIKEKFEDIFFKRDVDFPRSKAFSRRFQVLTEEKHTLENLLTTKSLDDLIQFPDMELEFLNNALLFRCSRKPVSIEEANTFCELAKVLCSMFE